MHPSAVLRFLPPAAAAAFAVAFAVGCALPAVSPDAAAPATASSAAPSESRLQRIATSAISGKGFADVRLIDGVAYVTGDVANAIDRNAVVRTLGNVTGVERVESFIKLDM